MNYWLGRIKVVCMQFSGYRKDRKSGKLEIIGIGNYRNYKISKFEIVEIGNNLNWKISKLEIIEIGNC